MSMSSGSSSSGGGGGGTAASTNNRLRRSARSSTTQPASVYSVGDVVQILRGGHDASFQAVLVRLVLPNEDTLGSAASTTAAINPSSTVGSDGGPPLRRWMIRRVASSEHADATASVNSNNDSLEMVEEKDMKAIQTAAQLGAAGDPTRSTTTGTASGAIGSVEKETTAVSNAESMAASTGVPPAETMASKSSRESRRQRREASVPAISATSSTGVGATTIKGYGGTSPPNTSEGAAGATATSTATLSASAATTTTTTAPTNSRKRKATLSGAAAASSAAAREAKKQALAAAAAAAAAGGIVATTTGHSKSSVGNNGTTTTTIRNEECVKIKFLTGTLYMYRGRNRRAEFIRRV